MKYLIVVDMQVDFINGALGSDLAVAIVPNVVEKVKSFDGEVIFTRDQIIGYKGRIPCLHYHGGICPWHCLLESFFSLSFDRTQQP